MFETDAVADKAVNQTSCVITDMRGPDEAAYDADAFSADMGGVCQTAGRASASAAEILPSADRLSMQADELRRRAMAALEP